MAVEGESLPLSVTSLVLWEFNPYNDISHVSLKVTYSDGNVDYCNPDNYEYLTNRTHIGNEEIATGYYRFQKCLLGDIFWTDWYYLSYNTVYSSGVLQ